MGGPRGKYGEYGRRDGACVGKRRRKDGRFAGWVKLPDGRRHYLYARTRHHLQAKVAALRRELDAGRVPAGRRTVAQFLEAWLDAVRAGRASKRRRPVGPATLLRYEEVVARHLLPHLGRRRLDKLEPAHLDAMYDELGRAGLAGGTVAKVHAVLGNALNWGLRRQELARNVAALVDVSAPNPRARRALSPDQVGALLRAASGARLEALYWLAIATGERFGGLAALRWEDLDLDGGLVHFRRSARRVGNKGILEGGGKTAAAARTLTLPPLVVAALRRHRRADRNGQKFGRVFGNTAGGMLEASGFRRNEWLPLLERAGLELDPPLTFHELRHTAGSIMVSLEIDVETVRRRLGHARASVTLDLYTHTIRGTDEDAALRLDGLLRRVV